MSRRVVAGALRCQDQHDGVERPCGVHSAAVVSDKSGLGGPEEHRTQQQVGERTGIGLGIREPGGLGVFDEAGDRGQSVLGAVVVLRHHCVDVGAEVRVGLGGEEDVEPGFEEVADGLGEVGDAGAQVVEVLRWFGRQRLELQQGPQRLVEDGESMNPRRRVRIASTGWGA